MRKIQVITALVIFLAPAGIFADYGETSLFAGTGDYSGDGGSVLYSTINGPYDMAFNPDTGDYFLADTLNNVIRKVSQSGIIETLAGDGTADYAEGIGAAASFNAPRGVCVDASSGLLYVADSGNNMIRTIDLTTSQTAHVAGSGYAGAVEGNTILARFSSPRGVAVDNANNAVYVADYGNSRIRKIDLLSSNNVSTIATSASVNGPMGVDFDANTSPARLYIADTNNHRVIYMTVPDYSIYPVAGGTMGYQEGQGTDAYFRYPSDVSINTFSARLYVADRNNQRIRGIDLLTDTTYFMAGAGAVGDLTGNSLYARFNYPYSVAYNPFDGFVYICDTNNNRIKKTDPGNDNYVAPEGGMSDYGGDGNTVPTAAFSMPSDAEYNTLTGRTYICDSANHVIRMIDEYGVVSTLAGTGTTGSADGSCLSASFNGPSALALDSSRDILYVCDKSNNMIRAIDLTLCEVTTVAGSTSSGDDDGTGAAASFFSPEDITVDIYGNKLYVADTRNQLIRQINLDTDAVTTISGMSGVAGYLEKQSVAGQAVWNWPGGILYLKEFDVLIVADTQNNLIRRIGLSPSEPVQYYTYTITGDDSSLSAGYTDGTLDSALYNQPSALAYDPSVNILYIGDKGNYAVRAALLYSGGWVGSVAGNGYQGYAEGTGSAAQFGTTGKMTMDLDSQVIYIADGLNNRIRKIDVYFPSPTPTVTETHTPTLTPTETPTVEGTETVTPTISATYTISETHTVSPTITGTETQTVSPTVTESGTISETPSDSPTITGTKTPTITPTITQSASVSPVPTQADTGTVTPTVTGTLTAAPTETITPTYSPVDTAVNTETITPTTEASETITSTVTPTYTPSEEATGTYTPTVSGTSTPVPAVSVTRTATDTVTPTVTQTVSPPATVTVTQTWEGTPTVTPVVFGSATVTPTATETPVDFFETEIYSE